MGIRNYWRWHVSLPVKRIMGHDRRFVIGGDSGGLFWGFVPGSMSFKQSSYRCAKYKLPVEPRSSRISTVVETRIYSGNDATRVTISNPNPRDL